MTTEAEVIRDLATVAALPATLDAGSLVHVVVPEGANSKIIDLEVYGDAPRRVRGIIKLVDVQSFIDYFQVHGEPEKTWIYTDVDHGRLTAVFDDDDGDGAGWRQHRAVLQLTHTAEWNHWAGRNSQYMGQQAFAEHIENGLAEIVQPTAAQILELAQSFQATTKAEFKSAKRLGNGEQSLIYTESMQASAGKNGEITIPEEIKLGIAPWRGVDRYEVTARFRYRLEEGNLKLAYQMVRPHEVLEAAFAQVEENVIGQTGGVTLAGTPADPR